MIGRDGSMKPAGEDFRAWVTGSDADLEAAIAALAGARALTHCAIRMVLGVPPGSELKARLAESAAALGLSDAVLFEDALEGKALHRQLALADFYIDLSENPDPAGIQAARTARAVVLLRSAPAGLATDGCLTLAGNDSAILAATLATLIDEPLLRRHLIARAEGDSTRAAEGNADVRVEGPFDTSYSLAMVNRFAALALARRGATLVLEPQEAVGPYRPNADFLAAEPAVAALVDNGARYRSATTVLRNMYPLRLTDMKGINNGLVCYGWEESRVPEQVVAAVNRQLQLVCTTSTYVSRTLMDNGVTVPLFSCGDGADHILAVEPDQSAIPPLGEGLRFLHISSCFPRKGIDVLLDAYGDAFCGDDPVVLVIKTFPNPHHDIDAMLRDWSTRHGNPPRVVLINRDLGDGAIRALYLQCQVLVAPSRGEGFGLPMAEAMLHQMPVITTGYGGQRDFCRDDTAWLLDYRFARAETHMDLADSVWVDPDRGHLASLLADFARAWSQGDWQAFVGQRTGRAERLIREQFSWDAVAYRLVAAVASLDSLPALSAAPKRGFVTTWNSRCGIASYSQMLIEPALGDAWILANEDAELLKADGENVIRCWRQGQPDYPRQLFDTILELGLEQVHFQFNFGFFACNGLRQLLADLHDAAIQTFITFHATAGGWADGALITPLSGLEPQLSRVTRIFVHSVPDLNRLKSLGVVDNVSLFPHGVISHRLPKARPRPGNMIGRRVLASYGFLLPHKGILQLIEAFALILAARPESHLLLVTARYPLPLSGDHLVVCQNHIRRLGLEKHVTLITDYLPDEDSLAWLAHADLLVFPYQHTLESSSAAVRWGLASGKPVYCTPLDIFDDVSEAVTFLPGTHPEALANGLLHALDTPPETLAGAGERQRRWLDEHDWRRLSHRLRAVLLAAHRQGSVRQRG